MVSVKNSNQAAAPPPPRGVVTQDHPGSPSVARRSPASRENKAALTLDPVGDEAGADILRLGELGAARSSSSKRSGNVESLRTRG